MELDLRLTTLDRLDEVLALPAATISVGHEGCPHKLPALDALRRAADTIRARGKSFTFVAPISYERFMPQVVERVAALIADGPTMVAANDVGMVLSLAELGAPQTCGAAAGHGLSFTFEQQPWIDRTLALEAPGIRESFYQNSLQDPEIWPQLREWGVTMIEADALPHTSASLAALREAGFAVNVLLDVVPIAYARACHTARHYQAAPPHCAHLCDRPFELSATHRWQLLYDQLAPMSRDARAAVPGFTVFGNVVYRRVGGSAEGAAASATRATLDVRYYTPDELQSRISLLAV